MSSKLEVNIRSLISHCEEMAKEDKQDWRLKKFIKSLDTMIIELKEDENKPAAYVIDEYCSRLLAIKNLTNYVEPPAGEKKFVSKIKTYGAGEDVIKEIRHTHNSKYEKGLRIELLGDSNSSSSIRKRNTNEALDQTVKYYSNVQEKLAEDMLLLTKNLKEQTETANKIIRKDTEIATKSTKLSDRNVVTLTAESQKLQDHSKNACKCWMWITVGIVIAIFISMVMFMKIMKKRVS